MFKKSNKTQRSPEGVGRAEGEEMEEMMRSWKKKMGEVLKGLKGELDEGLEEGIEADKGRG